MLFLPFDAFGAYNQGKKEANAENWADIFNNEKAEQAMQKTDMGAATFDTSVAAVNAQNQLVVNKGDLGLALQPGALSSANLSSEQQIDYNARLAPQLPTINQNKVDASVAGSSNDLFRQQAVVPAQAQNQVAAASSAVADQQWQADGSALVALGTARGNAAGITAVIAKYFPGATVVESEAGYAVQMPNGGGLVPFAAVANGLQERFRPSYRTAANGTVSEAAGGGAARPAAAAKPGAVVPAASVLGLNRPAAPAATPPASADAPQAAAPAAVPPSPPPAVPVDPRLQAIDQQIASLTQAAGALPLGSQQRAALLDQRTQMQMQRGQLVPAWWQSFVPPPGLIPDFAQAFATP